MNLQQTYKTATHPLGGIYALVYLAWIIIGKYVWILTPAVAAVWIGWVGVMIGHRMPKWGKVLAGVGAIVVAAICGIFYVRGGVKFNLPEGLFYVGQELVNNQSLIIVAYLLTGMAMPKMDGCGNTRKPLVMCVIIAALSGIMMLINNRAGAALGLCAQERVLPLLTVIHNVSLLAIGLMLVLLIYLAAQLAQTAQLLGLASRKWFKVLVIVLAVILFALVCAEVEVGWFSVNPYGCVRPNVLLVASQPLVVFAVMWAMSSLKNKQEEKQC